MKKQQDKIVIPISFTLIYIDAHGLKIQGEGPWGLCQILGGRVYRGCESFDVLLHF